MNKLSFSMPDLVELGILSKPITEFTNADIGTEVSIHYTDVCGIINSPIIFEIVGVNHHTSVEYQHTITLMTKNIIRHAAFDANEPNNPDLDRKYLGNNRWSKSNIRQWLNSSGAANSWFTSQHKYDTAPDVKNVGYTKSGTYANEPGFLTGFSDDVLQHFTDITNKTVLCDADGCGSETTIDRVFLASYTEMFGLNNSGISEGRHLSVRYPDNNSRIKSGAFGWYLMRSPSVYNSFNVRYVYGDGYDNYGNAYNGSYGIAPLIVIQ